MRACIVAAHRSEYALETPGVTLEELIYETTRTLLSNAGRSLDDVDAIAIASSDAVDGRAISSMVTGGPAGCYARDLVNSSSSGEHALVLASLRIMAGRSRLCLVANWAKPSEAPVSAADRLALDPFFYRALGLERTAFAALQAAGYVSRTGSAATADAAAARASEAAARNPRALARPVVDADQVAASRVVAWPLRELHLGPLVDGSVALLVASEDVARESGGPYAVIEGLGWASDSYWLGDRRADAVPALGIAGRAAFEQAAIADPAHAFDVIELCDASAFHELIALEALGLAPGPHVNPSGGQLAGWPEFAFGLDRVAEVFERVTTRGSRGLAHAAAGFGQQSHSVFVLARGGA
jgi:acetyl-CoA C-acetyltransferase